MVDTSDEAISTNIKRDQIPVRILEQCLHMRALLTLILETQTMILAHQTGKDFMEISETQIDLMNEHIAEWVVQLNKAGTFEVIVDDDPPKEK